MTMHGSPQTLGRFQLVRELARGGQGVVYEAFDPTQGERRAIKLLLAADSALQHGRVQRELESLGRFEHPRVVKLHEVGTAHGRPYLVYDFVDGESLEDRLQRGGPLPWADALRLTRRLAGAVAAAHAVGVLHRDLKPGNVLLDRAGEPHLTDFGLAALRESDQALTRTGQALGSPGYWPPEQAAGDRSRIGPRSDVYGLGAILYAAVTGQPPQAGRTLQEIAAQTDEPPPPPSAHLPELPPSLDEVCLRCLQSDPERRYASAEAVAAACREAQVGVSSPQRGRAPVGVAAAIVALAALGAAILVARSAGEGASANAPEVTTPPLGEPARPEAESRVGAEGSPPDATPSSPESTPAVVEQAPEDQAERDRMIAAVQARDFALLERLASARVARRGDAATCDDWTLLATGQMGLGRAEEGLASFAHASGLDRDNEVPLKNLVSLLGARGRWGEALPWATRLCELRPDNAWNWTQHAHALWATGRYAQAVEAADRARALAPDDADAWELRARSLLMLGRYDEARLAGEALRRSDPGQPWGWMLEVVLLVRAKERAAAREALATARGLVDAGTGDGVCAHGVFAGALSQFDADAGEAYLAGLLKGQSNKALFLAAIGARYLEFNEMAAAEHFFRLSLEAGEDARVFRQRAVARLVLGNLEGAREDIDQALRGDATSARSWSALSLIRSEAGDVDGALEAATRADELGADEAARTVRVFAALRARRS